MATAPAGAAGLAAALAAPPDPVLTDLLMPHLHGAALCRRLMAEPRTRGVPVLIVTALADGAAAAHLAACPPDGVIGKFDGLDAVLRAVGEALAAGVRRGMSRAAHGACPDGECGPLAHRLEGAMQDESRGVTPPCPRCGRPITWLVRVRGGVAAPEVADQPRGCVISRDQWADLAEQAEARVGRRAG